MNDVSNERALFQTAYEQLFSWCQQQDFAGHDPFDGLNSRLFQLTPLAKSRNSRFVWSQVVKRSPIDLRGVARVPRERNAKGIALFALAQLANHRRLKTDESESKARALLSSLISLKLDGYSGASWGYNFDWQSRNFFAPRDTPTVVPTAFAARALIEAAHEFQSDEYLQTARSTCNFLLHDLPRTVDTPQELCFSYAPQTNTRIFNASLLAAEVLASVGYSTGDASLCEAAERAARYVINRQRNDGSWSYGTESSQSWIDNFHTAYVLFSLKRIVDACALGSEFQAGTRARLQLLEEDFLSCGWVAEILP